MAPFNIQAYRTNFEAAYNDVTRLYTLRFVWKNIVSMLQTHPNLEHDSLVNNWLVTCYNESIAIGIRRQTDSAKSKSTIGSLLKRIEHQAPAFTRQTCGFEFEQPEGLQHPWLNFAPSLKASLDPGPIRDLGERLTDAEHRVRFWVNKRIAHLDMGTRDSDISTTTDDIERALAGLGDAVFYLYGLFHPNTILSGITPTAGWHWLQMFEKPWFLPDEMTLVDPSDPPSLIQGIRPEL